METNYHPDWQNNRIKFIMTQYPEEFFKGKRILELGPFNGYIGAHFAKLGADVVMVEGRQSNVDNILEKYGHLDIEVQQGDLDTPDWLYGKFDIIINFGLVYHFEFNHKQHILNCINNCDLLFFETVIFDSNEDTIHFREEKGEDQSLSKLGGTPSTSFIENIFNEANVSYTKYSNKELNGSGHRYDWVDTNSKVLCGACRRFWILENNT